MPTSWIHANARTGALPDVDGGRTILDDFDSDLAAFYQGDSTALPDTGDLFQVSASEATQDLYPGVIVAPVMVDADAWVLPALDDDGGFLKNADGPLVLPALTPAPVDDFVFAAKDVDLPLVRPGVVDGDDFLIKSYETGPQVQPGVEDVLEFAPPGIIHQGFDQPLTTPVDAGLHIDDFGLIGHHGPDDWLFLP